MQFTNYNFFHTIANTLMIKNYYTVKRVCPVKLILLFNFEIINFQRFILLLQNITMKIR